MLKQSTATNVSLPPVVGKVPFIGCALDMRVDVRQFLAKLYRQHGPVFRLYVLGQTYTVMAGLEANRFLAREGDTHLSSAAFFGGFGQQLGSDAMLLATDGPAHRHRRKIERRGYSRDTILTKLPEVADITREIVTQWQPGQRIPLFRTLQRIATEQLGFILAHRRSHDLSDAFPLILNTNLKALVLKTHPKILLQRPKYIKAKRDTLALAREIVAWHRENPPTDRSTDLVDDLIDAIDENGVPYSEAATLTSVVGAYLTGIDTVAATSSFLFYEILKSPELLQRITAEVDQVYANGGLCAEAMHQMPTLHGAAMETLRLYPVAPLTLRTVAQPYTFGGFNFEPGMNVLFANTVTHCLPEYFPDPEHFDVDRYSRPDQPKVVQAFAPYALGAHTCIGAGIAEIQIAALVAAILHFVSLRLDPPNFKLTVYSIPTPNPGYKYSLRVVEQRQPAAVLTQ